MATPSDTCRSVRRFGGHWLHDEPSAARRAATTRHLLICPLCRDHARFHSALRESTRRAVHDAGHLRGAFERRIDRALTRERQRRAAPPRTGRSTRGRSGTSVTPWALLPSAAAVLLVFNGASSAREPTGQTRQGAMAAHRTELALELVRLHAAGPTHTRTDVRWLAQLERELVLPVRGYPELERLGATPVGASAVAVAGQPLAQVAYTLGKHRCTLYVFDARSLPLARSPELTVRVAHQRPVLAGKFRGYSLATVERHGLGYAIASDLDLQRTAELTAALR